MMPIAFLISPSLLQSIRERFPPRLKGLAEHRTLNTKRCDGQQFTSHIDSQPRAGHYTACRAMWGVGCIEKQSEQVGAGDADFVITRGWGRALISKGGCDGLVSIIQWADRALEPATWE